LLLTKVIVVYLETRTGEAVAVDRVIPGHASTRPRFALSLVRPANRRSRSDPAGLIAGWGRVPVIACACVAGALVSKWTGDGSCGRHREAGRADTAQEGQILNRFAGNRKVGFIPMDRADE
jgi:hypothetical protein